MGKKPGGDQKKSCVSAGTMLRQENKESCTLLRYERRQGNGDEVLLDRRSEEWSWSPYPVKALQVPREEVGGGNQSPHRRWWRGQPSCSSGTRQGDGKLFLLEKAACEFWSDPHWESTLEAAGIRDEE